MSCWVLSEVIFWPKFSFCNRASLRFFMHMKTHFSTISFYLNLQINNFFKMTRLMYIYVIHIRHTDIATRNLYSTLFCSADLIVSEFRLWDRTRDRTDSRCPTDHWRLSQLSYRELKLMFHSPWPSSSRSAELSSSPNIENILEKYVHTGCFFLSDNF